MKLVLDHVALVTPDLGAARENYENLGFQLTRESSHKGRVTPDGPVVLWGSGNHCAMFRRGYYEILGLTDPNRYHDHFKVALDRFHGVSLVALGCESASDLYESSKDRVPGLQAPIEVGRDVPYGQTTREGLFRIVHLDEEAFPEAELFFIEHATPDVYKRQTLCSEAPEETAARFERATGLGGKAVGGSPFFTLDRGQVVIARPGDLARSHKDAVLPAVPCVAVVTLSVKHLEDSRKFLESRGVTPHACDRGIWIRPERTGGVILEFAQE